MKTLRRAVIAPMVVALVCLSGAVTAQDREGYYASVSGLLVVPQDTEWSESDTSVDIPMKNGFGVLAAFGYSLPSGLRAEIELGYREYDFDSAPEIDVEGQFSTVSLMVNGIYSFDLKGFRPYAGLGVGLATHTAEIESLNIVRGSLTRENDTGEANVFAYQGLAGIGYPLSDQAEVRLGYRYFGSAEGDFGAGVEISSASHNFEVGLLYRF